MSIEVLRGVDFSAADQPEMNADLREYLEGWFRYQRHEFLRKLRDLTPENMVAWSVPPVELSVLGLVRHMTQMEHVYVSWGLGGGEQTMIYGDDDYAGGSVETVDDDLRAYFAEVERSDMAIADVLLVVSVPTAPVNRSWITPPALAVPSTLSKKHPDTWHGGLTTQRAPEAWGLPHRGSRGTASGRNGGCPSGRSLSQRGLG